MYIHKKEFIKTCILIVLSLIYSFLSFGQKLTGTKTIPGNYSSIQAAVTALNIKGVGNGGVIFNIAAGYTETITSSINLTETGTSTRPITFRKNPSTSGANPKITSYTGLQTPSSIIAQDGIWSLSGSDYITIDGIDLEEKSTNTINPFTMEYGYALHVTSSSDGCNNVTIQNCTISLSRVNNAAGVGQRAYAPGSVGILVINTMVSAPTTSVTPTSSNGTQSNNSFYNNTIKECNVGIALIGYQGASPYTLCNNNNIIGGSASTGNTIYNFGGISGSTTDAYGIYTQAEYNLTISGNTINNNNGTGADHPAIVRGIFCDAATSASLNINQNTITIHGGGTTQDIAGIYNNAGSTAASNTVSVSDNTITGGTYATATSGGLFGIVNTATPDTIQLRNNIFTSNTSSSQSNGDLCGINNTGAANNVIINANEYSNNLTDSLTASVFIGIQNTGNATNVTMDSNIVLNNMTNSLTGAFYGVYQNGSSVTNVSMSYNKFGSATQSAIRFFTANSSNGNYLLYSRRGSSTATVEIAGNEFYHQGNDTSWTGRVGFLLNAAAVQNLNIHDNVCNSINVNSTGNLILLSNTAAANANSNMYFYNNNIVGPVTKLEGGSITGINFSGNSDSTSYVSIHDNIVSNIQATGATTITGFSRSTSGLGNVDIYNNTIQNIVGGTSTVTGMTVSNPSNNANTYNNTVQNISSSGVIRGIQTASTSGNDNVYANTVNGLYSDGNSNISGILITAGVIKDVYKNKIFDLQTDGSSGSIYGISCTGSTLYNANIRNNMVSDLRGPNINNKNPNIRGINISTTAANSNINLYFNTIYLNETSTGNNFTVAGVYHTSNSTATTCNLTMQNNLIYNTSISNGNGKTVGFYRSSASSDNYSATSDHNLIYCGDPAGDKNYLYWTGSEYAITIKEYKTRFTPADANSTTEDIENLFLSTNGNDANFLHLNPTIATQVESGGMVVPGLSTDFDYDIRAGYAGYTGTGTAPDIGADEYNGKRGGVWTGNSSTSWNTSTNWLGNLLPDSTMNIIIPEGLSNYPIVNSGNYNIKRLTMENGSYLTLNNTTLNIYGRVVPYGTSTLSAATGTLAFYSSSKVYIPGSFLLNNTLGSISMNASGGLEFQDTVKIKGYIDLVKGAITTNDFLQLKSDATQTAAIYPSGTGTLIGTTVFMERYLPYAYGYHYISTPFQNSTVNDLSPFVSLTDTFPKLYSYDESQATSTGWTSYTTTTNPISPLLGYAANFGNQLSPVTIQLSGSLNNNTVGPITLYNHNNTYTQGFNLVGNPYPSPINWNASSGWTKTNIDNAVYYFNPGTTDQYSGSYSSYVNGVSSDGVANNIIPSMQGFFVHVTNGTYPVTGSLTVNNNARLNNLTATYHKTTQSTSLIRLAGKLDNDTITDYAVLYVDDEATDNFDIEKDALKIKNSADNIPNIAFLKIDGTECSILSMQDKSRYEMTIPVIVTVENNSVVEFFAKDITNVNSGKKVFFIDADQHSFCNLSDQQSYKIPLNKGTYKNRFFISLSENETPSVSGYNELNTYLYQDNLYVNLNYVTGEAGEIMLYNTLGQIVLKESLNGSGMHILPLPYMANGVYIATFVSEKDNRKLNKKMVYSRY